VTTADLRRIPGVAECDLDEATLASLPADAPPAPWDCACTAVVWLSRPGRVAAGAAATSASAHGRSLAVIGGMVGYEDTPVGPYSEVLGAIGVLDGRSVRGTVPFMAVDSTSSLVGGRQNWSLPKTLASFTGTPTGTSMTATGRGWKVTATPKAIGPAVPTRFVGGLVQRWPDGSLRDAVLRGRASARAAIVRVEVESTGSLAEWLKPGWHVGAVLTAGEFTLPEPR
jgi:hypothetical protein